MFLLYLVGILCSLLMFAPSMIPGFVKFPVAFVVVLLVVFFFNKSKGDTIYRVYKSKTGLRRWGIFNPLLTYISACSYTLGFAMLFTYLSEHNMVDIVANIRYFLFTSSDSEVFIALALIVFAILTFILRNSFKTYAYRMRLQSRSVWYIVLTLVTLGLGVYGILNYYSFDVYSYLNEGKNLYVYFGIVAAVVLFDLICNLIVSCINSKNSSKVEKPKTTKQQYKEEKKAIRDKYRRQKKAAKKAAKLAKKSAKNAKKASKKASLRAKKAHKRELKLAKKNAKLEKKLAKKQANAKKKLEKKNERLAKKAGKRSARSAKKSVKKAAKLAKKNA